MSKIVKEGFVVIRRKGDVVQTWRHGWVTEDGETMDCGRWLPHGSDEMPTLYSDQEDAGLKGVEYASLEVGWNFPEIVPAVLTSEIVMGAPK